MRKGGTRPAEIDGFLSMDFLTGSRKEVKLVWVTVGISPASFVKQGKTYLPPSQKHRVSRVSKYSKVLR